MALNLNWDQIAADVTSFLKTGIPIAETLVPAAAPAIQIASTIIQGVLAAEPTAMALYNQVKSGTPVTAAQLASYYSTYKADDDALNADIQEHLAAAKAAG